MALHCRTPNRLALTGAFIAIAAGCLVVFGGLR